MPIIKFGHTVDNVSLYNLENLLRICKNKVDINLEGTNLNQIIGGSKFSSLLTAQKVEELS